jgi:hypothetical protein
MCRHEHGTPPALAVMRRLEYAVYIIQRVDFDEWLHFHLPCEQESLRCINPGA